MACRFDGKKFLEQMKGKKIMFVGDSLSADHCESLLCLLHASVPSSNAIQSVDDPVTTVVFQVTSSFILAIETTALLLMKSYFSQNSSIK